MITMAALLIAALAVPAWLFRGGSINGGVVPSFLQPRIVRLIATPLVVCGSLAVAFTTSWLDAGLIALSGLVFTAVSTWGWLDSSDLGRDGDRSFWTELGMLSARFLPYVLCALPVYFVDPVTILPFVAIGLLGALAWLPEKFIYFDRGLAPTFAVAETVIGSLLALTTALAVVIG